MPRFPKAFGRRKSNATTFDEAPPTPVETHSFKVFERAEGSSRSFDGGVKLAKATPNLAGRPNTSHLDDDNMFNNLGKNRGSGASNTNTASTTDNSSRLSAVSTAPSSTDAHGREEWRSAHDKPLSDIPVPPIPKSSAGFSLKHAGRSLSWGRNKQPSPSKESPPTRSPVATPPEELQTPGRARAVTASSYASTATPPKLESKDLGLSLGGDFSDMFSGFGKRKSANLDAAIIKPRSESPENLPSPPPPARSFANNRSNQASPSHLTIDRSKDIDPSPLSWNSQNSHEALMSSTSPPPVPIHASPQQTLPFNRPQRPNAPDGLRRSSALAARRQSTLEYGDAIDEDALLLQESVNASRRLAEPSLTAPKVRDSWALPLTSQYKVDDATLASWVGGSMDTTPPQAKKAEPKVPEDNMFSTQSSNTSSKYQGRPLPSQRDNTPQNKVMTPAQFERYKQDQDRLRSVGGQIKDDEDDEEEPYEDDDEDEAEKNKQLAKQRRKQEAHMAVYRQQMMKMTGEAPAATPRPPVFATQSSPNLANIGKPEEGEEEDEEVPLAILQAHGFPSKTKPPQMRSMGSNPNLRSSALSTAGGVVDPRLPVFARNLPQDPYFGAGIMAPMNRESMAFSGGAGSVAGGPSRALPPGGLVGVIATEERSRAMRRGSPKPPGDYGTATGAGFNGMGMLPSAMPPPAGSMYNGMGGGMGTGMGMLGMGQPMGPMGMGMGPMGPMQMPMMTPGDQAQIQMSQQMQQFMQMQMQFMQMMTAGQGQPQQNGTMSQAGFDMLRPDSATGMRPGSSHQQQRGVMGMLDPNAAPWMQQGGGMYTPSIRAQGGYAPSIAPSERSNVGLPGRYRPVSHAPPPDAKSRASTMSGGLQGWDHKNPTSTIRPIVHSALANEDEDDEEGWEEMAKKREKKKSLWRTKKDKDSNGFKDLLGYAT